MCTLREFLHKFMSTSCSILLRMRNVLDKNCTENQDTQFVFSNFFFNCIVHETQKYRVWPDRSQMTIQNGTEKMQFSCQITKARTQTHFHNINKFLLFHSN
jgi:hypothetical protein